MTGGRRIAACGARGMLEGSSVSRCHCAAQAACHATQPALILLETLADAGPP